MSQIVLYFLHSISVLSFHIDVVLTLSTTDFDEIADDLTFFINVAHQWPLLLTWFNFNPSMDK